VEEDEIGEGEVEGQRPPGAVESREGWWKVVDGEGEAGHGKEGGKVVGLAGAARK